MADERVEASYLDSLKLLIKKIRGQGFDSITGRFPKNGLQGMDNHIKIVPLSGQVEVCLKDCSQKSEFSPKAENLEHDLKAVGNLFTDKSIHPVKLLGRIDQVLVMESTDNMPPLLPFLAKNKELVERVHQDLIATDQTLLEWSLANGKGKLGVEPLVNDKHRSRSDNLNTDQRLEEIKLGKAQEHAFVKKYDPSTGELEIVFIDPIR